jgi:hypothetical protein
MHSAIPQAQQEKQYHAQHFLKNYIFHLSINIYTPDQIY